MAGFSDGRGQSAGTCRSDDALSAATKKPVTDRLSGQPGNRQQSALHGTHVLTEPTFVAGSLVFVDQALADRFIDNGNSFLVRGLSSLRIPGGDRFEDIFDMGAQRRALAGIAPPAVFRLTGPFTSLSRIRQGFSPVPGTKEPATMRISAEFVNLAVVR
jgi:hypothetical protein